MTVTTPTFQAPGQSAHKPKRLPRKPSPNTGTCTECGGIELPMRGRLIDRHPERRIRRGPSGLPEEYDGDTECAGSLGRAEPGSVARADGAA